MVKQFDLSQVSSPPPPTFKVANDLPPPPPPPPPIAVQTKIEALNDSNNKSAIGTIKATFHDLFQRVNQLPSSPSPSTLIQSSLPSPPSPAIVKRKSFNLESDDTSNIANPLTLNVLENKNGNDGNNVDGVYFENKDTKACDNEGIRDTLGTLSSDLSSHINQNLRAYRVLGFLSFASLLTFVLKRTPPFQYYRSIESIPGYDFRQRAVIKGRIVGIQKTKQRVNYSEGGGDGDGMPVVMKFIPMSYIERLVYFTTPVFRANFMTDGFLTGKRKHVLVEVRNVTFPPAIDDDSSERSSHQWIDKFALQATPVSCRLISRRLVKPTTTNANFNQSDGSRGLSAKISINPTYEGKDEDDDDLPNSQIAIVEVKYLPGFSLLSHDLGSSLVKYGRGIATVEGSGSGSSSRSEVIDQTRKSEDMEEDVRYIKSLYKVEEKARSERVGCWDDVERRGDGEGGENGSGFWKVWGGIKWLYSKTAGRKRE